MERLDHYKRLDALLKQAKFPDLKGEEYLVLAQSWAYLKSEIAKSEAEKPVPEIKPKKKGKK